MSKYIHNRGNKVTYFKCPNISHLLFIKLVPNDIPCVPIGLYHWAYWWSMGYRHSLRRCTVCICVALILMQLTFLYSQAQPGIAEIWIKIYPLCYWFPLRLYCHMGSNIHSLTLSQCTLTATVYTGMPLVDCALWYDWASRRAPTENTGTLLENLVESVPHWNVIGENLAIAAYTGTPLEGL